MRRAVGPPNREQAVLRAPVAGDHAAIVARAHEGPGVVSLPSLNPASASCASPSPPSGQIRRAVADDPVHARRHAHVAPQRNDWQGAHRSIRATAIEVGVRARSRGRSPEDTRRRRSYRSARPDGSHRMFGSLHTPALEQDWSGPASEAPTTESTAPRHPSVAATQKRATGKSANSKRFIISSAARPGVSRPTAASSARARAGIEEVPRFVRATCATSAIRDRSSMAATGPLGGPNLAPPAGIDHHETDWYRRYFVRI